MHGDLDDDFDWLGSKQQERIDLDEIALRAARREPPHAVKPKSPAPPKRPLKERLREFGALTLSVVRAALQHGLIFATVLAVTGAAVSYGLDPDHVLDDVALERAQTGMASLQAQISNLFSP